MINSLHTWKTLAGARANDDFRGMNQKSGYSNVKLDEPYRRMTVTFFSQNPPISTFVKRLKQLALMKHFRNCFMVGDFLRLHDFCKLQLPGDILRTFWMLITCKQVQLDNLAAGKFTARRFSTLGLGCPANDQLRGIAYPD